MVSKEYLTEQFLRQNKIKVEYMKFKENVSNTQMELDFFFFSHLLLMKLSNLKMLPAILKKKNIVFKVSCKYLLSGDFSLPSVICVFKHSDI